jgi:hypothetical protein
MQLVALTIAAVAAIVAAESLSDAIGEFPSCSLGCLNDNIKDEGCQLTDFNCICNDQVKLAVKLGTCTGVKCTGSSSSFGEFCSTMANRVNDGDCFFFSSLSAASLETSALPDHVYNIDAGKALGDLCDRWHEDPPTSEVSAATSTLGAAVASATATSASNGTMAGSPTASPTNAAVGRKVELGFMGVVAAAALLA